MTPFEKKIALGGLIIGLGSLGVATLDYRGSSTSAPAAPPQPQPVVVRVEPVAPAPPPSRLPQLLTERTIGRQLQYFEAISGPAQSIEGVRRSYQVDGCDIEIELGSDQQIEALSVRVTGSCSFEWRDMAHNLVGLGRPEQTTLGQFLDYVDRTNISHLGGCVSLCGNMAAPELWLQKAGSHADGFIDVVVGVSIDTMGEAGFLGRLSNLVEANLGRDATYELGETCDRRVVDWIKSTMGPLRIERVELRLQYAQRPTPTCDLSTL